jgi:cysteine synthase B
VEIGRMWDPGKTGVRILAKLEGANPGGSVKDRPAYYMIKKAIASAMGYRIKLIMPACVSEERRSILIAMGAELELTPGCDRTDGAITRAHHIVEHFPEKYYMPNQFANPANWTAHYETTAPEIVRDTNGEVDAFVAGMGTTGTLMGCSRYFRERNPRTKVIGVEPSLNHRVQGLKNMKESIVPQIYDSALLDIKVECSDDDAFNTVRNLALVEGLFCGISSGAAMWGAMNTAKDMPRGSTVVVIFPDRGDRYLSTEVFRSGCAICPP